MRSIRTDRIDRRLWDDQEEQKCASALNYSIFTRQYLFATITLNVHFRKKFAKFFWQLKFILKTHFSEFLNHLKLIDSFLETNQNFNVDWKKLCFPIIIDDFVLSFPEFRTYANIEITKQGYRHLIQDGYRYGETKVTDRCVYWRCTANIRDDNTCKSKRCVAQITTKIQNGYEMIRTTNVKHSHPKKQTSRRRLP